jgi:hypothetical protein
MDSLPKGRRTATRFRNQLHVLVAKVEMDNDKPKKKRKRKAENDCLCGCGAKVAGKFKQGHDQRVKGMIKRAIDTEDKLFMTDIVQANGENSPFLTKNVVIELCDRWGIEYSVLVD